MSANNAFDAQIDSILRKAESLWPLLNGSSIFMTGGTGFFGRWLLESLARAHETLGVDVGVTVLTRNPEAFLSRAPAVARSPAIRFHQGDVRSFPFPEGRFSHVVHGAATAAAATFFRREDALTKFATSFEGTRRALDFAVHCGAERLLMLGSGSVYGGMPGGLFRIPEDHAGAPAPRDTAMAIGHGKRAAEFLCECYAETHGLDYTVARCFTFVGAHLPLDIHYAIGNFIADALWRDAITIKGDGTPFRSYLFTGDLVVWLLTLLLHGGKRRVYNVGSDQAISLADLAHAVRDVVSPGKPVRILGQPQGGPANCYVPEIRRAREDFGLDVWTPLEEAIRLTAAVERTMPRPVDA